MIFSTRMSFLLVGAYILTTSIVLGARPPKTEELSILIPYKKPETSDTYLCTSVQVNSPQDLFIVGFSPIADMSAVHHMLLYGCKQAGGTDREIWNCGTMGGSSDLKYNDETLIKDNICADGESKILYAWAKNAPSLQLPENVAFNIGGESGVNALVLQLHYGDSQHMPNSMSTPMNHVGLVLDVTQEPQPFLAGVHLLATGGSIPAQSITLLETACEMRTDKIIYPFAFRTHSHTLGKVISGYRVRKDSQGNSYWTLIGKKDPQLPQMFYPVEHKLEIGPGDILAARCTMVSDRTRLTQIGTSGTDEMCNFYIMYYVTDGKLLEYDSCWHPGPYENYWEGGDLELNNIPADASQLP